MDTNCEFPQGLKPNAPRPCNGTAEAVPLQGVSSLWGGAFAASMANRPVLVTTNVVGSTGRLSVGEGLLQVRQQIVAIFDPHR